LSEVFVRRGGGWRVTLLPGWDAIEDLMGAALVSRAPTGSYDGFRPSVSVVEVAQALPEDLERFADEQAAALAQNGAEIGEIRLAQPREPGVLVVSILARRVDNGVTVVAEQSWADANSGSLVFTMMAAWDWFAAHRDELVTVPRSVQLGGETGN
jgi:hypothetical protein